MSHDRRFIYVFEFDDGVFYVGHTADIRDVLSKFRERTESSIVGYNPRLQYVEAAVSEEAAELRESEVKKLILSNPDQMRMMALDFHNQMRELGLEEDS